MINLQTINLLLLPSVDLNERSQLPSQPCIYFAIDSQGIIQYIGRSVNPRLRWNANKFWQITGLPRATAFRLWRDRDIYPDRTTVEVICKKLKAQPGDFLIYMEDIDEA